MDLPYIKLNRRPILSSILIMMSGSSTMIRSLSWNENLVAFAPPMISFDTYEKCRKRDGSQLLQYRRLQCLQVKPTGMAYIHSLCLPSLKTGRQAGIRNNVLVLNNAKDVANVDSNEEMLETSCEIVRPRTEYNSTGSHTAHEVLHGLRPSLHPESLRFLTLHQHHPWLPLRE
jgi:hypothetical protein